MPSFDVTTPVLPVPAYVYATTDGYDLRAVLFEDGTEQRYLVASGQATVLHYDYSTVDLATATLVRSLYLDADGSATQFTAIDYRDGSLVQVQFADETLRIEMRPAGYRVGPVALRVIA